MRFRLLRGIHVDADAAPVSVVEVKGVERPPLGHESWSDPEKENIFYPGDIFDTRKDLEHLNHPAAMRFERVRDSLESLTLSELRHLAEERGISLGTSRKKEEVLSTLRAEGVEDP